MKTIDVLRNHESPVGSGWQSEAESRRNNRIWLRYSQYIALSARERMAETGITQKALAEKLGCTQQHVSFILKGTANLTLETIAKLESALEFSILRDAFTFIDGYAWSDQIQQRRYLSEAESQYSIKDK